MSTWPNYDNWEKQNGTGTERSQIWRAVVQIMKEKGTFVDTYPPREPIDIMLDDIRGGCPLRGLSK